MTYSIKTILAMSLTEQKSLYKEAKKAYYDSEDGTSPLTDAQFDRLEARITELAPDWAPLKATGTTTKVGSKRAKVLAVPCPSLNKIKAEDAPKVVRWLKHAATLSSMLSIRDKLDGSSLQGVYTQSKAHKNVYDLTQLCTRGDGVTGKDISYFIPHVNVVKRIDLRPSRPVEFKQLVVRFEAVMKRSVYTKKWAEEFDSARALASAVFNRQDVHPAMADVDLIALKVQSPSYGMDAGLTFLKGEGFKVAPGASVLLTSVDLDFLVRVTEDAKAVSKYELDGIVLCTGSSKAEDLQDTEDRPKNAVAFKVNSEADAIETVVEAIEWNASKHSVLVPKAIIKPIQFGNVTVKQAALHNARWMKDMGIGVGAVVRVIRSGDIIPKIIEVVKAAKAVPPSRKEFGAYHWDGVNIVLDTESADVQVQRVKSFFVHLDMEDLAEGMAEKLVAAGYTSTAQLPSMTREDFAALPGVKSSASKYADQMKRVKSGEFDTVKLMVASGVFPKGVGKTRLYTLAKAFPAFFAGKPPKDDSMSWTAFCAEKIATVKGVGPAFAELFRDGYPEFMTWMKATKLPWKLPVNEAKVEGPLNGVAFSWTGYRDNAEEERIKSLGGSVAAFSTRKTNVLFVREDGKASSKADKANAAGVTVAQFIPYIKKASK